MKRGVDLYKRYPLEDVFTRMILGFLKILNKSVTAFGLLKKVAHPLLVVRFPAVDPAGPVDLFQDQETGDRVSKGHL